MDRAPYILIVDDDADDVDFLLSAFRSAYPDTTCEHRKNSVDALAFLMETAAASVCPDVTFLDLHMPGKNGYDALVELRTSGACGLMPIIVLSTSLLESEAQKCMAAGCDAYFSKPSSLQGYDEIVSKAIAILKLSRSAMRDAANSD